MSQSTKIQWCDDKVNPVMGCSVCELWMSLTDGRQIKRCYSGTLHGRWRGTPEMLVSVCARIPRLVLKALEMVKLDNEGLSLREV
jgi:hypothetical protein